MAKKKFTSEKAPEIVYEVLSGGWIDDDTYVLIFNDMKDVDGDIFHLEVEYHKDEKQITYTRVYDYENVDASQFVSPCFKMYSSICFTKHGETYSLPLRVSYS